MYPTTVVTPALRYFRNPFSNSNEGTEHRSCLAQDNHADYSSYSTEVEFISLQTSHPRVSELHAFPRDPSASPDMPQSFKCDSGPPRFGKHAPTRPGSVTVLYSEKRELHARLDSPRGQQYCSFYDDGGRNANPGTHSYIFTLTTTPTTSRKMCKRLWGS